MGGNRGPAPADLRMADACGFIAAFRHAGLQLPHRDPDGAQAGRLHAEELPGLRRPALSRRRGPQFAVDRPVDDAHLRRPRFFRRSCPCPHHRGPGPRSATAARDPAVLDQRPRARLLLDHGDPRRRLPRRLRALVLGWARPRSASSTPRAPSCSASCTATCPTWCSPATWLCRAWKKRSSTLPRASGHAGRRSSPTSCCHFRRRGFCRAPF